MLKRKKKKVEMDKKFVGYKVSGVDISRIHPMDVHRDRTTFQLTLVNIHNNKSAKSDTRYTNWTNIFHAIAKKHTLMCINLLSSPPRLSVYASVKELKDWKDLINQLVDKTNKAYLDSTCQIKKDLKSLKQQLLNIDFSQKDC